MKRPSDAPLVPWKLSLRARDVFNCARAVFDAGAVETGVDAGADADVFALASSDPRSASFSAALTSDDSGRELDELFFRKVRRDRF